jgi:hypothetical protein
LTGDEKPDSATVARLIVDPAKQGELDSDRLCNTVSILLNAQSAAR